MKTLLNRLLIFLGIVAKPEENDYYAWADARLDQLDVARVVAGKPRRGETPRERRIRLAMVDIEISGRQPTPGLLVEVLGDTPHRQSGGVSLNGRDARTYAEVMAALGYVRVPRRPGSWQYRWARPAVQEGAQS